MREETPLVIACYVTLGVALGVVSLQLTVWGVPGWCAAVAVLGTYYTGVLGGALGAAFDETEDD